MIKRFVANNNLNSIDSDQKYIDTLISNIVELINIVYPKNIASIYLIGSYVDDQIKFASDIDIVVILKDKTRVIKSLKKILCHISPVVFDVKFYNIAELLSGHKIIDPCITYKRKLLYGNEDMGLFKYDIAQYLDLNLGKIEVFLKSLGTNSVTAKDFKTLNSKIYYSIISRLMRYHLGYKYKIITFTKEQSFEEFLEKESLGDINNVIMNLLHDVGKNGYKDVRFNYNLFSTLYIFIRNETNNSLPLIKFN